MEPEDKLKTTKGNDAAGGGTGAGRQRLKDKKALKTSALILCGALVASVALYGAQRVWLGGGKAPVAISSVTPTGEVSGTSNITIDFNQNMVEQHMLEEAHDNEHVVIEPQLAGRFKWVSPHRLRFYPDIFHL